MGLYRSYPWTAVYMQCIRESIRHSYGHRDNPDGLSDLLAGIRPDGVVATTPNQNMLGWRPAVELSEQQVHISPPSMSKTRDLYLIGFDRWSKRDPLLRWCYIDECRLQALYRCFFFFPSYVYNEDIRFLLNHRIWSSIGWSERTTYLVYSNKYIITICRDHAETQYGSSRWQSYATAHMWTVRLAKHEERLFVLRT